jgi:hypothetical protein
MLIDYVQAAEQGIIQAMREGHETGKIEGRTLLAQEICRSLGIDHSTPPMSILGEIARLKAAAPCTLDVVRQAVREEMGARPLVVGWDEVRMPAFVSTQCSSVGVSVGGSGGLGRVSYLHACSECKREWLADGASSRCFRCEVDSHSGKKGVFTCAV